MKKYTLLLMLFISASVVAQTYFTRTGNTDFKASVEAFEPVEATNNSTTVILKTDSGDLAAQLFITAFKFKVALMQEHFNENYMDSNKHPKAIFRGTLENFNLSEIKTKTSYNLTGSLTVRGVKKEIATKATATLIDGKIIITSLFTVAPQDFEIDIPSVVRKKIADKINININYELVEKK